MPPGPTLSPGAPRRLPAGLLAAAVLAGFWLVLQASLWEKSATYDETVHAAAGCSYWRWGDYRLNPEAGNLPQRVAGLPLALGPYPLPSPGSADWRAAREWGVADAWFHRLGNDFTGMLHRGRAACGLLAVALGALVWRTARRMFGPAAGMLALMLYVLDPTILANGALMTSDTAAALFFLAAVLAVWSALGQLSAKRVALAGLAVGGLLVSKMSAFLILPAALVLGAARLARGGPLAVSAGAWRRELHSRRARAAALALAAVAGAAIAVSVVWGFYGFRYSAFAAGPGGHDPSWGQVLGDPPGPGIPQVFDAARRHELLPEAYVYGCAYAWRFSRWRDAFLNGEHSLTGWPGFFPYTFLVKTPLPVLGILALSAVATAARWRARRRREGTGLLRQAAAAAYDTAPLWVLLAADLAAVMSGHLNIGHRHMLPVYPALFILGGAAVAGEERLFRRLAALAICVLAAETAWRFPDYLSYFNGLVRPSEGYRHLVDSSLDWGQDLPAAKRYVDDHPRDGPFILSYFGSASPAAYGVRAETANCAMPADEPPGSLPVQTLDFAPDALDAGVGDFLRRHPEYELAGTADVGASGLRRAILLKKAPALRLRAGTYLVSATVLQQMEYNLRAPWGPWNRRFEERYQRLRIELDPLMGDDPEARAAALARGSARDWLGLLKDVGEFDALRFSRLAAWLRRRPPDGNLHGSILVFHLSGADLGAALDGPPPELGRDLPGELVRSGLLD